MSIFLNVATSAFARSATEIGLIYGTLKMDGGFNESARVGASEASREFRVRLRQRVISSEREAITALQIYAKNRIDNIILTGANFKEPLAQVAPNYPKTHFTIIDAVVDLPNVRSVVFKEEEAGFLVGAVAAMKSQSGVIGFIGALPIAPIQRYGCGYVQGAMHQRADIAVQIRFIGSDFNTFRRRDEASAIARKLIQKHDADVLFAAAGAAGQAALETAAELEKFGIGVDRNQNQLFPGAVLTSALKMVDKAVYESIADAALEQWSGGIRRLGIKEGGVDWALDDNNTETISGIRPEIQRLRQSISSGSTRVGALDEISQCAPLVTR